MRTMLATAAALGLMAATVPALAQEEAATVTIAESEEYGTYLADGDGRPLYLFTADTQGGEDATAEIACEADCLDAWPLFTAEGEPEAGEGADAEMLGTLEHEDETVVTYNGWPLYYFAKDEGADAPQGQDIESFGGEWYLVTPEGEKVGHE